MISTTFDRTSTASAKTSPRYARRIGAVLAGLLVTVTLSTATDAVMHATGVFPADGALMSNALFVLATAYRCVYQVAGGFVAARVAPDRPERHALALGLVGLVLATLGAIAMRGAGPSWYPLALVALALPTTWAGGKLRR